MHLHPGIFKAYDIRGTVGRTLDEGLAEHLGRAFGTEVRRAGDRAVAVGRDGRLSGPALSAALIQGLRSTGLDVVDLGPVTTPMLYYVAATRGRHGCRSGIQVTGSHNPKDDNGFKMVLAGRSFYGEQIQALRRRIEARDYDQGSGRVGTMDILPEYRARIARGVTLKRPMKVVVDCGNGIPGASSPGVLRALGCEVVELYSAVDGRFPNHHPDPTVPANLEDLIREVKASGAELGLAFDGDGDRLGVVTADGCIIEADRQLMLFARDVLARHPGAKILFDVKCSQRLPLEILKAGGRPVMGRTGHSLAKEALRRTRAPLAGELSGHMFFKERWYGFDDATYTAARLLEIVSRTRNPSRVLNALPQNVATPELHVRIGEGEGPAIVARLRATARFGRDARPTTLDGLRIDWPDGFGLVRPSNTTPVLVLRFEGRSARALARIQGEIMAALQQVLPGATAALPSH